MHQGIALVIDTAEAGGKIKDHQQWNEITLSASCGRRVTVDRKA